MSDQNDTRVSLFKTIIEEIEGFNAFIKEMLTINTNLDSNCIARFENLFGYIHKSVLEETESGHMEVNQAFR